jgi:ATP-dependent Lon protease
LSQIIFIATANDLKTIARPLRDRMEIIQIPGYTFEDKLPIGKIHLLPKQIKMHGINSDILQVTDEALKFISKFAIRIFSKHLKPSQNKKGRKLFQLHPKWCLFYSW